jgi:PrcB C-terminal
MLTPLLVALTLTAPVADRTGPGLADDKTREPKIQARARWAAPGNPGAAAQQLVIRDATQAARALRLAPDGKGQQQATMRLAKIFKVPTIDWDRQMVIVATAGAKPTGGYSLNITKLGVKDKTLVVHWKLKSPGPGSIVTQAFTHPGQAILTDRWQGEVKFDPPPPRGRRPRK